MKVLFLRSNPVDPDSRVEKEVKSLLEVGYFVEIFCWDRESNHEIIEEKKYIDGYECAIYRIGIRSVYGAGFKKNLLPLIKFQLAIMRFLKTRYSRYDVLHACDFDTCFTGFHIAQKYGLKVIYDVFDYYADSFNVPVILRNIIVKLDHGLMEKSDALIICSEERKKQIGNVKQNNTYIIHNSPDEVEFFEKTCSTGKDKMKIGYVGILNDGRMIPEMLEVVSEHEMFELHIAGFGKFENLVKKYSNEKNNIIFYGKIPYNQTLKLEHECDVLTAIYDPSIANHKYAAPNKFYEALMLGKPLIMCKGTGFSDVVERYDIGKIIFYSKESLCIGFNEIYQNLAWYKSKKMIEQELYHHYFSWETMKKRLLEIYMRLENDCVVKENGK